MLDDSVELAGLDDQVELARQVAEPHRCAAAPGRYAGADFATNAQHRGYLFGVGRGAKQGWSFSVNAVGRELGSIAANRGGAKLAFQSSR